MTAGIDGVRCRLLVLRIRQLSEGVVRVDLLMGIRFPGRHLNRAVERGDDAGGDRIRQAERRSDRHDLLADGQSSR